MPYVNYHVKFVPMRRACLLYRYRHQVPTNRLVSEPQRWGELYERSSRSTVLCSMTWVIGRCIAPMVVSLLVIFGAAAGRQVNPPERQLVVALGMSLFFEARLSMSGNTSCATCHSPEQAFADSRRFSIGEGGRKTARNSPSLLNRPPKGYQFWDGRVKSLFEQVFFPLENPDEMSDSVENAIRRLKAIPEYRKRFDEIFGAEISPELVATSIAAFVESLHATPSDYERANAAGTLSHQVVRGEALFRGKGKCDTCHTGSHFTDERFHNTGVAWKGGGHDLGRGKLSGRPEETRAFKTPSLRELVKTAPYMHDGSLPTLEAVVEHYAAGGAPEDQFQDPILKPIDFTAAEREDLVAFLRALSDTRTPPRSVVRQPQGEGR